MLKFEIVTSAPTSWKIVRAIQRVCIFLFCDSRFVLCMFLSKIKYLHFPKFVKFHFKSLIHIETNHGRKTTKYKSFLQIYNFLRRKKAEVNLIIHLLCIYVTCRVSCLRLPIYFQNVSTTHTPSAIHNFHFTLHIIFNSQQ